MTVAINDRHAYLIGDRVTATYVPAGRWSVRVGSVDDIVWAAYAMPADEVGRPFHIASGCDYAEVFTAALQWHSAATVGLPIGRVTFAGLGDVTVEPQPELVAVSS